MTDEFAPLPDLTDVNLPEILTGDDNLTATLKRLLKGLDDPDGVISAFQSFASAP